MKCPKIVTIYIYKFEYKRIARIKLRQFLRDENKFNKVI